MLVYSLIYLGMYPNVVYDDCKHYDSEKRQIKIITRTYQNQFQRQLPISTTIMHNHTRSNNNKL